MKQQNMFIWRIMDTPNLQWEPPKVVMSKTNMPTPKIVVTNKRVVIAPRDTTYIANILELWGQ
jgi:hypothetical protein